MKKINLMVLTGSILLTGCGGSGDGKSATPPAKPITPSAPIVVPKITYYTPDAPKTGDTYTYESTSSFGGAAPLKSESTEQVGLIKPDGSYYKNAYFENNSQGTISLFDKARNLLESDECSYSPKPNVMPLPWYVGEISVTNTKISCLYMTETKTFSTSEILAVETITVAAGTFKTVKIHSLRTSIDEFFFFPSSTFTLPHSEDSDCWYDIKSGFPVKCIGKKVYDLPKIDTSSVTGQILVALFGNGIELSSLELKRIGHVDSSSLVLTGKHNSSQIHSLYLTEGKMTSLGTTFGHTVEFNSSQPVKWTLDSKGVNVGLISGDQTVVVDGVTVKISMSSTGLKVTPISAPVVAAGPVPFVVNLNFKGTLLADPTKNVSVSIGVNVFSLGSGVPVPISNCYGALKFC